MNATDRRVLAVVDVDGLSDSLCELVAIPASPRITCWWRSFRLLGGYFRRPRSSSGHDLRRRHAPAGQRGADANTHDGEGDIRRRHSPNEYVPLSELVACTWTLVLGIQRFCGNRPIR